MRLFAIDIAEVKCEVQAALSNVCFQGQPGSHLLTLSSSGFDPLQTSLRGVGKRKSGCYSPFLNEGHHR